MAKWIIHPRLLEPLAPTFPQTCAIQQGTESRDAAGQPLTTWATVAGLAAIGCRVETLSGSEPRTPEQVYTIATHLVFLDGYFPTITPKMRMLAGGLAYNILAVNQSAFGTFTNLLVEVVV